jgi:hypothetical protein
MLHLSSKHLPIRTSMVDCRIPNFHSRIASNVDVNFRSKRIMVICSLRFVGVHIVEGEGFLRAGHNSSLQA